MSKVTIFGLQDRVIIEINDSIEIGSDDLRDLE
jgi:hypothetical protein